MNKESDWNQIVKTEVVQGPLGRVIREKIVEAGQKMKSEKAAGPLEKSVKKQLQVAKLALK